MFNKNFYPTPDGIIAKMVAGGISHSNKVLEPSAGKGNILDYLKKDEFTYATNNLYCIEKEPELQMILKEKGYNLLGDDFLSFDSEYYFDYIIMNPPFDTGVKHLLHAFDISKGAEIRCLLNAETLDNAYSKERRLLLDIIKANSGTVMPLANCFMDAERKTSTNVVLVCLKNLSYSTKDFEFNLSSSTEEPNNFKVDDIDSNQVAQKDVFENLAQRYTKVKEVYTRYIKTLNELNYYAEGLVSSNTLSVVGIATETSGSSDKDSYNKFTEKLRAKCWDNILSKTKISSLVTESVRKNLDTFTKQQGFLAFTKENMENLFDTLMQSKGNIMESCILEAFELMTKYYDENRDYIEGWKTNNSYKVNKKVILPNAIDTSWTKINDDIHLIDSFQRTIDDIEKAMAFISGKNIGNCKCLTSLDSKTFTFGTWIDSEFFKFKVFKKGTIHLMFKDEWLYQEFNRIVAKGKNWLPKESNK